MAENDFLQDVRAGLSVEELGHRYDLTPAKVSARIRWAREHGKLDENGDAALGAPSAHLSQMGPDPATPDPGAEVSGGGSPIAPSAPMPMAPKPIKTREEVAALLGSLKDKNIQHRLHSTIQSRIQAYEKKIGRKDASFRMAQQDWAQKERLRMLGLTINDIRRARGILPPGEEKKDGQ